MSVLRGAGDTLPVVSSFQNPFNLCAMHQAESGARRWQLEDGGTGVAPGQLSGPSLPSDSISSKEKYVYPGKAAVLVAVALLSVACNHPLSSTAVSPVLSLQWSQ